MNRIATVSLFTCALVALAASPADALRWPGGPGGPIGPIGPGCCVLAPEGPTAPAYFGVSVENPRSPSFTVNSGWYNTSVATRAVLSRGPSNVGPWTQVASVSATMASGSNSTLRDPTPPRDQTACYRVTVYDNTNYGATSPVACVLTPDGRSRPLWRTQLRVTTGTVSDAGTDSAVHVRLNSPPGFGFTPSGNETWIDSPADDFEAGTTRTYDLLQNGGVRDITDVKMISLLVDGDDAVCIARVELLLNERTIHISNFGNTTCRWASQQNQLSITHANLRAQPAWAAQPATTRPIPVPYATLNDTATAIVGDALHGTGVGFRDTSPNPAVQADNGSSRILRWEAEAYYLPIELEAQFATDTTCNENGDMIGRLYVADFDVDHDSWLVLVAPLAEALVEHFTPSLPGLGASVEANLGPCEWDLHLCFISTGLGAHIGPCD